MTKLYYTQLSPTFIATTAAAGYAAANLANPSLTRPWRATGVGATDIEMNLPASVALGGVFLHDCNFAEALVETSPDGVTYTPRPNLVTRADAFGRRRGLVSLAGVTARYVILSIQTGPGTTDGAAYWRVGAAYLMQTELTLARAPNKGYDVDTDFAQQDEKLANGRTATAAVGAAFDTIRWQFLRKYTDSLDVLQTQLRQGTVIVDMGLPQFPHHVWPVRGIDATHKRVYPKANSETSAVTLTEVV